MNALQRSCRFRIPPGPRSRYRKLPIVGSVLDDLVAWFQRHGYTQLTIRNHIKGISRLVRRLQYRREPFLKGLTQLDLDSAYDWFRTREPGVAGTARALGQFFRERQLIPEGKPTPLSTSERELKVHSTYLREMRGMADSTVEGHQSRLRFFLRFLKVDKHPSAIRTLRMDQIDAFLRRTAKTNNRFSLQHVVASLRGFLRRQHAQGVLKQPLHQQIDTPRTYRLEQLPRALPWEQIVALLRSIDRSQPEGLRDFTILYLATRYGLRSGELVRLTLDDLNWRTGTLQVPQTKTRQTLQLPLTDEAGEVLARYLKAGRPNSEHRELFLRRRAPTGALAHTAVHDILEYRIRRSGLELPTFGTHVLRHSFAVHLLRRGVRMSDIGDALGHRDVESTAVYLRLAVDDLREVGLPVPETARAGSLDRSGWRHKLPKVRTQKLQPPLKRAGFGSGLAASLRSYLANRRALGRRFAGEENILRRWDDFLQRQFRQARGVRAEMFHSWAQTMPHLTANVRRNRLRIVRNFLLFHARNHPKTYLPDVTTFPKPCPYQPPRLVSPAEMARVLATASRLLASHSNPLRAQTVHLALVLLFCCGLRRGELLRLRLRHFDSTENVLRIEETKFHKSRLVPLNDSVVRELRNYVKLRERHRLPARPDSPLIWSNRRPAPADVYCAVALASNWQYLCLAAGVLDRRGRPPRLHDLRHSFAVAALHRWYREGVEVQAKLPHLATYLGHVCPVSTHHYLHLTPDLREAASQRFHRYALEIFGHGGGK
jgi:integrase/recombinase XerD